MAAKKKSKPANMTLARLTKSVLLRRIAMLAQQVAYDGRTIDNLTAAGVEDEKLHAESMAALVEARNDLADRNNKKAALIDELQRLLSEHRDMLADVRCDIRTLSSMIAKVDLPDGGETLAQWVEMLRQGIESMCKANEEHVARIKALETAEAPTLRSPDGTQLLVQRKRHLTSEYGS